MKIIFFAAAAALLFGACGNKQKNQATDSYETDSVAVNVGSHYAEPAADIDEEAIISEGFKSRKGFPVVVDFSAAWCGPCRQFKPIFHETAGEFTGKVEFIAIDVDSFPKLAEKYGIEAIPTVIYFDTAGKEVSRTQGFISKDEFSAAVSRLVK